MDVEYNKVMQNTNTTPVIIGYIVRDSNARRFLNRPTYSGRVRGVWGRVAEGAVFSTREAAQSCASNLNSRRPEGYSAFYAQVRPVVINFVR